MDIKAYNIIYLKYVAGHRKTSEHMHYAFKHAYC